MRFSPHHLKRYKDISLLALKYGRPEMVSKFGLENGRDHLAGNGHAQARELCNDLERLGPTFVKLGQLLSSRRDESSLTKLRSQVSRVLEQVGGVTGRLQQLSSENDALRQEIAGLHRRLAAATQPA